MNFVKNTPVIFVAGFAVGVLVMYAYFNKGISTDSTVGQNAQVSGIERFSRTSVESGSEDSEILYENKKYGFSLTYPQGLAYKEFDEGEGSMTVVFQKPGDKNTSFQIYITPYSEPTITGERILFDIPSGDIKNLKEEQLTQDLRVATFISRDQILGEISEIWFVDGKYLYEATTFASLGPWLRDIIKSWKFHE